MDKKKGVKNILWGIAAELLVVAVGIIVPRLVLTKLGSEANGLLNSVTTVLAYLSVLEAGVGTASIQALYRPIAGGDRAAVSRIMSATDHYYRRTGRVYLAAVVAFALAYTFLIRTGIPRLHVFLVILLSGLSGVLNWCIEGLQAIRAEGFKEPPAVVQATDEYRRKMDKLLQFLEEKAEVNPAFEITLGELHTAFANWCSASGLMSVSVPKFKELLEERQIFTKRKRPAGSGRAGRMQVYVLGVRLLPETA